MNAVAPISDGLLSRAWTKERSCEPSSVIRPGPARVYGCADWPAGSSNAWKASVLTVTGMSRVIIRNLADVKVRHVFAAASLVAGRAGPESYGRVLAIVVRADGAAAWITSSQSIVGNRAPLVELDAFQKGSRSLLDSSGQIQAGSLKLRGVDLTWLDGTTPRSYALR